MITVGIYNKTDNNFCIAKYDNKIVSVWNPYYELFGEFQPQCCFPNFNDLSSTYKKITGEKIDTIKVVDSLKAKEDA